MKASLKVRDGQRPLVRAKVPMQVAGLPMYSGVTVGDAKELALHVGTNLEAGPSCGLSYKPNDAQSPLTVLLKTGFGLWGSPHAAPFTIFAEFNLSRRDNVSFMLRLKPKVGSFSLRRHFLSTTSGSFGREVRDSSHDVRHDDMADQEEVEVAAGEAMNRPQGSGDHLVYDTDYGFSPMGLGHKGYMSCEGGEPCSPHSNSEVHHVGDGHGEMEMPGTGSDHVSGDTDQAAASATADHDEVSGRAQHPEQQLPRRHRLLQSWSGQARRSWGLTVHTAIPLGRQAMARVQWGMRTASPDSAGGSFHGYKLPVLVLDKISISTQDPRRKAQSSAFPSEGPLSYGMRYFENPVEDGSQLGLIASTCCYMRNQLQSLHLDNRSLKRIIEDMKAEMTCGEKKPFPPKPPCRPSPDEDSIRSQLFEELQKKTASLASPSPESIFDMSSEGLLSDKKPGDPCAKAKSK